VLIWCSCVLCTLQQQKQYPYDKTVRALLAARGLAGASTHLLMFLSLGLCACEQCHTLMEPCGCRDGRCQCDVASACVHVLLCLPRGWHVYRRHCRQVL
jgi:hypothetical protein